MTDKIESAESDDSIQLFLLTNSPIFPTHTTPLATLKITSNYLAHSQGETILLRRTEVTFTRKPNLALGETHAYPQSTGTIKHELETVLASGEVQTEQISRTLYTSLILSLETESLARLRAIYQDVTTTNADPIFYAHETFFNHALESIQFLEVEFPDTNTQRQFKLDRHIFPTYLEITGHPDYCEQTLWLRLNPIRYFE